MQYWGGPHTYRSVAPPRLRMRHAPFKIGPAERDAWLRCMRIAVDEADLAPEHRDKLWQYLEMAADSLVNPGFEWQVDAPQRFSEQPLNILVVERGLLPD